MHTYYFMIALLLLFGFLLPSLSAWFPEIAQQQSLIISQARSQTETGGTNATQNTTAVIGPTGFPPITSASTTTNRTAATVNATNATTVQPQTQQPDSGNATGTLSTEGLISSFVLSTGQPGPPSPTNATRGTNATNATVPVPVPDPVESLLPYILGGDWRMVVNNGNVTSFDSNFTMVHTDGTDKHAHRITNFVSDEDSAPLQPNTNETALVIGNSNIETNGSPKWNSVETTVILDKLATLSVIVDSNATENHFKNQPIYGIVTSPDARSNSTNSTG